MTTIHITKKSFAKKLGVSRASLYYTPKKPSKDVALKKEIETVMRDHRAYGHRRIALALGMNKKKINRIMRAFGLRPNIRRSRRPSKPDDIGKKEQNRENIALRLCPIQPHVVWAGDFTYFWCFGRFWYLATVIDVFTREIVGWHIANHHTTSLIIKAFKDAMQRTGKTPYWFHSDQGSEYVSGSYAAVLAGYDVIPSQSKKSSPWQNGFQESFYANFKLELENTNRFNDVGEFIEAMHQQMCYYNQQRIHTALKMPPSVFRQTHEQKTVAFATTPSLLYLPIMHTR